MKGYFRLAAAAAACLAMASCGGEGAGGDIQEDTAAFDAVQDTGGDAVGDAAGDAAVDAGQDVAETPLAVEAWGPYAVGYKVFETTDAQRGDRAVPIAVYYPAQGEPAAADTVVACDFEKSLLPNAVSVPDAAAVQKTGGWPVVLFSHGSGASKEMYKYLLEFLASYGYVVVAPDHTGNVGFAQMMPEDMEMTSLRVTDMLWVIAWLGSANGDEAGVMHGLLDMDNMAAIGHSYGGHIVMAMGGAAWDWDHIADQCAQAETPDPYVCSLQNHTWDGLLPAPGVKAVISLANDASEVHFGIGCAGAEQIDVPVMYMGGTADTIAVFADNAAICYPKSPSPACLVQLTAAGHLDFTDAMAEADMPCDRSHHIVRGMALAFLEKSLNDTAGTTPVLSGDAAAWADASDFTAECK